MFNKIIRLYNQNRRKFWTIVAIIVVGLLLLRLANYLAKLSLERQNNATPTNTTTTNSQTYSIISDTNISTSRANKNNEEIENFIKYCNNKQIKNAYDMLSDDCKKYVFQDDINRFEKEYYDIIFSASRLYSKDNWITSNDYTTYKVTYTNNLLSDGKYDSQQSFGDYITVTPDYKLNILKFVSARELQSTCDNSDIEITAITNETYIENETLEVKIKNNTINDIDLEKTNKIYIVDSKDKKYNVSTNGIEEMLKIKSKETKNISLTINKTYNARKVKELVFEGITVKGQEVTIKIDF